MAQLTDLPLVGGNATGVAVTSNNTVIAAIDGKLYSIAASGGAPQLIDGDAAYSAVAVAPSGEVYAVTATEIYTFNLATGAKKVAPIDPSGPLSVNGRVEDVEFRFSPSGIPFIVLTSNYPRSYVYYSMDTGTTWTQLKTHNGLSMRYSGDVAFSPSGELFVGDYEGLYTSTDMGETWTLATSTMPNGQIKLLYTSAGDIYRYIPGGGSLGVSHDEGRTFTEITQLNRPPFFIDMQQGSDGALYTLANSSSVGAVPVSRPMSFMRSTDGGTTWTQLLLGQAHEFAMRGSTIAMGLVALESVSQQEMGGVCFSRNSGATWEQSGSRTVGSIQDFGFDKEGHLVLMAEKEIFRQAGSRWEVLGSQLTFNRFTTAPSGAMLVAHPTVVYYSSDDGATWTESPITDYLYPGIGTMMAPVALGRRNGEFIISVTTYRNDLSVHTNGALFRIGNDGVPVRISGAAGNFVSMVEDANGTLYATTVNFADALVSTDGGDSWQKQATPIRAMAFNSINKAFWYSGTTGYSYGTAGDEHPTELKMTGFTEPANYISSAKFGPDDKLYLLTIDQGLYISKSALK